MPGCSYCSGDNQDCPARNGGWACTRQRGHRGPHVACGTADHALHKWRNTEMPTCVIHDCQPAAGKGHADGTWCHASAPKAHYVCSRAKGHTGDHVACNTNEHELERWPNQEDTTMTDQLDIQKKLLELLEAAEEHMRDAYNCAQEANNQAEYAESSAYTAKDNAENAEREAQEAKDQARYATEYLDELEGALGELRTEIEALKDGDKSRDLKAEINRWKPRVYPQLQNGSTHSHIAANLGISEFLVQCIQDEYDKDRAAA